MLGCIMRGKAGPERFAAFEPESRDAGFQAMRPEIIHDQVDCGRFGVLCSNRIQHAREIAGGPTFGRLRHMFARLGLDGAKNVGRTAANIFVVSLLDLTRLIGRDGRRHVREELYRFFVQTYDRFRRIKRLFVEIENVLHSFDVLGRQLRHTPHFFPATA